VSSVAQIVGVLLVIVGVWVLWSPWALVIGGGLLLVVPELVAVTRRRTP
jgi:hypothetical protein